MRLASIGTVPPEWTVMNRMFGYRNITPFTTMLATARVTSKSNSTIGGRPVVEASAAERSEGMHVHNGVPAIELLPHRLEILVARPTALVVVAVDADAV